MNTPHEQLQVIINAPLPKPTGQAMRHAPLKEQSKAVRGLLKSMRLTGVSVTTPTYSMASSISISLPHERHDHREIDERGGAYQPYGVTCPLCAHRIAAEKKIEKIILAAFPDLDDRSEYVSDYFDYCLSIN